MKLKLKTATLIATIATGLYSVFAFILIIKEITHIYWWESFLRIVFESILYGGLFVFFYTLHQNQKK